MLKKQTETNATARLPVTILVEVPLNATSWQLANLSRQLNHWGSSLNPLGSILKVSNLIRFQPSTV